MMEILLNTTLPRQAVKHLIAYARSTGERRVHCQTTCLTISEQIANTMKQKRILRRK